MFFYLLLCTRPSDTLTCINMFMFTVTLKVRTTVLNHLTDKENEMQRNQLEEPFDPVCLTTVP